MSVPVHFVLNAFDSTVQMDLSASIQTSEIPTLDTSAVAVFEVMLNDMKDLFKFQTDSADVTNLDETDIKYYVDETKWPLDFNPVNAMMDAADSSGSIAIDGFEGNKLLVAHDFVRYLASKLFNTFHGVDLFNNEVELLQNLRLICDDSAEGHTAFDIKAALEKVGMNGNHADIKGGIGSSYMTNENNTSENICRVLLEQMTKTAIDRFATISDSLDPQSLPFLVGDSISFKLIVSAAEGQEELTGVDAIAPRSYEIRLNIVEAPANTEVADDEA